MREFWVEENQMMPDIHAASTKPLSIQGKVIHVREVVEDQSNRIKELNALFVKQHRLYNEEILKEQLKVRESTIREVVDWLRSDGSFVSSVEWANFIETKFLKDE